MTRTTPVQDLGCDGQRDIDLILDMLALRTAGHEDASLLHPCWGMECDRFDAALRYVDEQGLAELSQVGRPVRRTLTPAGLAAHLAAQERIKREARG